MVKICHIITTFYKNSGSARRTLMVARDLVKKGHTVHLIVGKDASERLIDTCRLEGLTIFRFSNLVKYISPKDDFLAFLKLVKTLSKERYDIVHTHLAKAGIIGRFAAKTANVKIVIHTVHGPTFSIPNLLQRKLFLFLEKMASRCTDKILFVGKELCDTYIKNNVTSNRKASIIYTGRDFKQFEDALRLDRKEILDTRKQCGIKPDDIVIGYVARIVPSKGHEMAIRACKIAADRFPKIKMIFIGRANLQSEQKHKTRLQKLAVELEIENNIYFLDYQPEIAQFYRIMDAFILPSLYEGLPNVLIEAIFMGLPVLSFKCDGVKEVLDLCPGAGYTIPQRHHRALAKELVHLMAQLPVSTENPLDHTRLIKKIWNIDTMLQSKSRLYNDLIVRKHLL